MSPVPHRIERTIFYTALTCVDCAVIEIVAGRGFFSRFKCYTSGTVRESLFHECVEFFTPGYSGN